ncbi:hypothetical protein C5167_039580 [Papaver somniferum]|uniref:Apoptosis inhibitor 5 n=1 Tax=Papaver somniferum TaxID=3469 RepID=A0A4Y7IFU2_PAPSO|nr:hypothetical protein C5167_039580 [Papaver somniferum]
MADVAEDGSDIEKLYEYGERLNESKDKSQNEADYIGIIDAAKGSVKAKQLAAQLIPRFFKFFPTLSSKAVDAHFDLCEEDELKVRVQAIRGLPLLCKDTPEYVAKIVDVLGQLLLTEENVERDAVHKALMSLLRQDAKASLTALFKHIENTEEPIPDDSIREKVLNFIKDKVFPLKAELLMPREEMERHITDLVKKSLQDVTGAEFKMFMDFLKSLSIFGEGTPPERVKELIEIVEGQADLDAQFARGAPNSKFVNYLNKNILPVFDKLPEERKLDLFKNLAEISPYTSPQDSRQLLPSVVQLMKIYMPRRKTGEDMDFSCVECLLYTFHHLSHKTPNATNSLCGYTIELAKTSMKKLTQGLAELTKTMNAAKTEEKASFKAKQQNSTSGLRTCNNILLMTKPLHLKAPSFIGDKINLSWKETVKSSPPPTTAATGVKRGSTAVNGNDPAHKKGRGEGGLRSNNNNNQLVNRAFQGLPRGGGSGDGGSRGRGRGRGSGRGRGWGGRGRGRGYY